MHSARWERKPRELFSVKWNYFRIIGAVATCVTLITLLAAYAFVCSFVYLSPTLPSPQAMRSVEFQVPLRVYSRNGGLIAQIGEQRRIPLGRNRGGMLRIEPAHAFAGGLSGLGGDG